MATCDPSALLYNNAFEGLSPGLELAVEVKLLQNWAGNTQSASELANAACASGFMCNIDRGLYNALEAQLLCNILNA
jgi:hypothetical protein